jgi:hypothetical protein
MKNKIVSTLLLIFLLGVSSLLAQKKLRSFPNEAFKAGEVLKFRAHYGFIDAGMVTLEVEKEMKAIGSRSCYHIIGKGFSVGAFDWFFKVRDHFETYLDKDAMVPWIFIRRVNEGGYKFNQNMNFNQYTGKVTCETGTYSVPEYTQDLISSFYYARCLDYSNAKLNEEFEVPAFIDTSTIPMRIKFVGREKLTTKLGTFNCLKFKPLLQVGRVFKAREEMTIWFTDDKNHIPVRLESKIMVGSIQLDLMEYSGLSNPISKVE